MTECVEKRNINSDMKVAPRTRRTEEQKTIDLGNSGERGAERISID